MQVADTDINVVMRQFIGAQDSFDANNAVFACISERLFERLALLAIQPKRILDLGARSGYQLARLQQIYPQAEVVGFDPTGPKQAVKSTFWSLKKRSKQQLVTGDPHRLPFADEQFDLVVSNLFLPWCVPHLVFAEVARIMAANGAFMFSSAGPDTLKEYRAIWAGIDPYSHVFGLVDMHDLGDALIGTGFAAPVLDRENITVDYPSIDALQAELVALGAGNVASDRRRGLMSPQVKEQLRQAAHTGRFAVTLELVQGHGWKGELLKINHKSNEEYSISVESLRLSLRNGRNAP